MFSGKCPGFSICSEVNFHLRHHLSFGRVKIFHCHQVTTPSCLPSIDLFSHFTMSSPRKAGVNTLLRHQLSQTPGNGAPSVQAIWFSFWPYIRLPSCSFQWNLFTFSGDLRIQPSMPRILWISAEGHVGFFYALSLLPNHPLLSSRAITPF